MGEAQPTECLSSLLSVHGRQRTSRHIFSFVDVHAWVVVEMREDRVFLVECLCVQVQVPHFAGR